MNKICIECHCERLSGLDSRQYSKINRESGFSKFVVTVYTLHVACHFCTVCRGQKKPVYSNQPLFITLSFHACNLRFLFIQLLAEAKRQLVAAGFHLLNENEEWDLKPGGRYFFTRNMSSLVAFAIGEK